MAFSIGFSFLSNFVFLISISILSHGLPLPREADSGSPYTHKGDILNLLVPKHTGFDDFVDCSDNLTANGFCIDVFRNALSFLDPKPTWTNFSFNCYAIGDNAYDLMIHELNCRTATPKYDAAIGDFTVSAKRLMDSFFTQAYLDSGIAILVLDTGTTRGFLEIFLEPFAIGTWATLLGTILGTSVTLWCLIDWNEQQSVRIAQSQVERRMRIFWFLSSSLIFFRRDYIRNPVAKFVMMAWIIFILLLGSSYTASLTSVLTVDQLSQKSLTMDDLNNNNCTVGFKKGSIVKDFLADYPQLKLIDLHNISEYGNALRKKEVDAVVDEIPYISLFLAEQADSACTFSVSQKLTIEGLGFAFCDRSLASAFSMAILKMSESGLLKILQDGWKLNNYECPSRIQSMKLDLQNSQALFVLLGGIMCFCIVSFGLKRHLPGWILRAPYFRVNQRQDAIDSFLEPSLFRSIRRRSSHGNDVAPEELA